MATTSEEIKPARLAWLRNRVFWTGVTAVATILVALVASFYTIFTYKLMLAAQGQTEAMKLSVEKLSQQLSLEVAPNSIPFVEKEFFEVILPNELKVIEGDIKRVELEIATVSKKIDKNPENQALLKEKIDKESELKNLTAQKDEIVKKLPGGFKIYVRNPVGKISLRVTGYLSSGKGTYLIGNESKDVFGAEDNQETEKLTELGLDKTWVDDERLYNAIEETWKMYKPGEIFVCEPYNLFKKGKNKSEAVLIIYTDIIGGVYVTAREFSIAEDGNTIYGLALTEYIPKGN